MNDDEYLEDYVEPKLSDKQRVLIDEYMEHLNKARAYRAAGYSLTEDPEKLGARVNRAFRSPEVQAEIKRRHSEREVMLGAKSPRDVMLENMAWYYNQAHDPQAKLSDQIAFRALSQKAAADVAPYIHPRLQAIAVEHQIKRSIDDFSDAELSVIALQSRLVDDSGGGDAPGPRNAGPEGTGP